jgi:hypothetical protein
MEEKLSVPKTVSKMLESKKKAVFFMEGVLYVHSHALQMLESRSHAVRFMEVRCSALTVK